MNIENTTFLLIHQNEKSKRGIKWKAEAEEESNGRSIH